MQPQTLSLVLMSGIIELLELDEFDKNKAPGILLEE
jgi:hypothetical protein